MVIIAYRLAQGWAGPGGFTIMTGRVPPTVYFKLLWLSLLAPYLVNTQSWSCYLHPDKVCTNTSACTTPTPLPPHLHLLHTLQPHVFLFFFVYKLFLYHTGISHGDQYRCNSLGLQKICLSASICPCNSYRLLLVWHGAHCVQYLCSARWAPEAETNFLEFKWLILFKYLKINCDKIWIYKHLYLLNNIKCYWMQKDSFPKLGLGLPSSKLIYK